MLIYNQSFSFNKNIPTLTHKYTINTPTNIFKIIVKIEMPEVVIESPKIPRTIPFAISKKKFESLSACLEFIPANMNKL